MKFFIIAALLVAAVSCQERTLCKIESESASEFKLNRSLRIYLDRPQLNTFSRPVTT